MSVLKLTIENVFDGIRVYVNDVQVSEKEISSKMRIYEFNAENGDEIIVVHGKAGKNILSTCDIAPCPGLGGCFPKSKVFNHIITLSSRMNFFSLSFTLAKISDNASLKLNCKKILFENYFGCESSYTAIEAIGHKHINMTEQDEKLFKDGKHMARYVLAQVVAMLLIYGTSLGLLAYTCYSKYVNGSETVSRYPDEWWIYLILLVFVFVYFMIYIFRLAESIVSKKYGVIYNEL